MEPALPPSWGTGVSVGELETPCLIVDTVKMTRNLERMAKVASASGVDLRPHTKTHKSPLLAKRQLELGAVGIAVAKLGEAEVMAEASVTDIMIANQIVDPRKLERAVKLAESGVSITFLVDSFEGAQLLSQAASEAATPQPVVLEVNITDPAGVKGRCGVAINQAPKLARQVADLPHLSFEGILGYRGIPWLQGREAREYAFSDITATAREEGELLVEIASTLRSAGVDVRRVIAGSTPSAEAAAGVEGVTEIQPGEYLFYDAKAVGAGICELKDCALSVRATVVSATAGRSVVDAGSKVLAGDIHPTLRPNANLTGFGILRDPDTLEPLVGAALTSLSEEHGVISHSGSASLPVGALVDIVPVHVCPTINLAQVLLGVHAGVVEEMWPVAARGHVW